MAPKGLSLKAQVSLELLEQGMRRLQDNVKNINEDYLGDIDLRHERIKGTEKASSIHTLFHR